MATLGLATRFMQVVQAAGERAALADAMADITRELGFDHFALSHHVDVRGGRPDAIWLHDYPEEWAAFYDEHALGVTDPVHRASHVTSVGFKWSQMGSMIPLTPGDRRVLALGQAQGIGDGFTVPSNVPGEARGSCSFALGADKPLPEAMLPVAQLAGAFAFEAARRLWIGRGRVGDEPRLTDRQRDCVLWMARGKTDWEIGRILGVSKETVVLHVKQARERYGVPKRTSLAIRTLFDGTLSFTDVLKH